MSYGATVQHAGKSSPGTGDTQAYASNNTAGNTLVAAIWDVNLSDTAIVGDSQANTWARAHQRYGTVMTVDVWVCLACAGGANTVEFSAVVDDDHYWQIFEFEGSSTLGPVSDGTGGLSPIITGALVTTVANALIVLSGATGSNRTFVAGTDYTLLRTTIGPPGRLATVSREVTVTDSYTPYIEMTNNTWAGVSIALYEATGAPPVDRPMRSILVPQAVNRAAFF